MQKASRGFPKQIPKKIREGQIMKTKVQNMKKRASFGSHIPVFVAVFLALSSMGVLAQHGRQPAGQKAQIKLVQIVRDATRQYLDINNAIADGYGPFLGCVSGSDHGAMGIHYVNPSLLNGTIDAAHPQALIYEPSGGQMRLVGVEFITDAATWLKNNNNLPPVLEGQVFLLVDSPNRYAVPKPFYELHVWAWRDNPQGNFVDWNDHVTCAGN
jgi:hypothetical protein